MSVFISEGSISDLCVTRVISRNLKLGGIDKCLGV